MFVRFLRSIWGVCPTRRGVSHETQANHANLCALSSIASEARFINLERQGHGSGRSSRPDGPYHRIDRPRRLKINQGRRKPSFQSPFASQTTPPLTDQVTTSLRRSIAVPSVAATRVGLFGAAPAHPTDPESDSRLLIAGTGQNNLPVAAIFRGGRLPSLASLTANGCFDLYAYSNFRTQQAIPR